MRLGGCWIHLLHAADKHGQLIDLMFADRRNTRAAYRFPRKALKTVGHPQPSTFSMDKLASYPKAVQRLQTEGLLSKDAEHHTLTYLADVFAKRLSASAGVYSFVCWSEAGVVHVVPGRNWIGDHHGLARGRTVLTPCQRADRNSTPPAGCAE
ncbi:DDE-type integrase/transposase/recombinase [Microvirga sp. TS319]|uniref:DDE-type integrase/transposase/recombinase n=1 Tax=Microvirga sp. TS319 TaxID=3241165 RepID=UPI00351A5E2D